MRLVIDQLMFASADPKNGTMYRDLFSKNAIGVSNGRYITIVECEGGQLVGYFPVKR